MNRGMLVVALMAMGAMVGCQSSMPDPNSTVNQIEFDLTVNEDRGRFIEDGLTYQGSVGPYAVYKVTGANPRLVGPNIQVTQKVGYAMLCGATHYFAAPSLSAIAVNATTMHLSGGESGLVPLVETEQAPSDEGGCTPPKDTFGNPLPDGGTPGGGGGGGATPGGGGGTPTGGGGGADPGGGTGGTAPCTNPDGCGTGTGTGTGGGGGANPGGGTGTGTGTGTGGGGGNPGGTGTGGVPCTNPDPAGCNPTGGTGGTGGTGSAGSGGTGVDTSNDPVIQRLNVTFSNAPKIGSTVLLRRVALTGARQHNDSHIIPNICCAKGQCSLGSVQ